MAAEKDYGFMDEEAVKADLARQNGDGPADDDEGGDADGDR